MRSDTLVKILGGIIAVLALAWVGREIGGLLVGIFALAATTVGLLITLVFRYGIPIAALCFIAYLIFGKDKKKK